MVWVRGSNIQHRGAACGIRSNHGGGASEAGGQALGPAGGSGARAWGAVAWGAGVSGAVARGAGASPPMASRTQLFYEFSSTTTNEGKTRNPDYFNLSHEDARQLMPVKLNLKVFPVKYFNIMDEFLAKQASPSPTFLANLDGPEEEAHKEDPTDGVDSPRDATQVPGSLGKQKNSKKAEKSMDTLLGEENALAAARN
ncbi:hypothetical protein SELMODRAFT_406623 [Selaginella moellendorffii]|uniref:Uncharacterized protein n=1 Tax=Selaginella moellendorffii TaxID=88036 RepID=D8R0Y1_SELML|nr:hypothetical protein SELMODRAFT_406623 [Selaginella moellendorffii]